MTPCDPPVQVESLSLIGGNLDFSGFGDGSLWSAIFTFLYVDLLDTTATLFAMAKYAKLMDENGNFEGQEVSEQLRRDDTNQPFYIQ